MESNKYIDQKVNKVITPSVLNKVALRSFFCQGAFNMERMQAAGWLYSLNPALKEIHTNKNDLSKSMKMHMEFLNTHPLLITFILGLVVAMEENKENTDTIRAIKASTMGPLGGIGDSLFWLTFLSISAGLGASFALQGSIVGPIIFFVLFNLMQFSLKFGLMHYGYKTGVKSIATLKANTQKFTKSITILGLTVVGSMIAQFIGLTTKIVIPAGQASVNLQESFDKVMPKLLPVAYTFLMLYLLRKKVSPLNLVILTLLFGICGSIAGII
ncbi:PTS system mannose/fructose/sorbose family transporter subunit IID [Streptobacillus moniliformis]|uniref:PTS system mannose/fructose/sorbose family transporter subunit IID n=1 Tax=Streptobacillus moniliformis TaxID=34105 RepID=UPI0007E3FD5E|nr:PTS system mannose/fructose/sorbose family transporter subunit IID [Streptobacillus moniliformis]